MASATRRSASSRCRSRASAKSRLIASRFRAAAYSNNAISARKTNTTAKQCPYQLLFAPLSFVRLLSSLGAQGVLFRLLVACLLLHGTQTGHLHLLGLSNALELGLMLCLAPLLLKAVRTQ